MNAENWWRSRLQNAAAVRACEQDGHDFTDPDPVTLRRHCRRRGCLAFTPGLPDTHRRDAEAIARQANSYEGDPILAGRAPRPDPQTRPTTGPWRGRPPVMIGEVASGGAADQDRPSIPPQHRPALTGD